MTVKEIAGAAGVSIDTVSRKVKDLFPEIVEGRKRTVLNQSQALKVMGEIRKLNYVQPQIASDLPQIASDQRIDRLENMVEKLCLAVATIPQTIQALVYNQPKIIEFVQDYYSIKGYASKLGQQILFSDALTLGRLASRLSRERGIEIRKVDDESYGKVNSYNIEILKEVFEI